MALLWPCQPSKQNAIIHADPEAPHNAASRNTQQDRVLTMMMMMRIVWQGIGDWGFRIGFNVGRGVAGESGLSLERVMVMMMMRMMRMIWQ